MPNEQQHATRRKSSRRWIGAAGAGVAVAPVALAAGACVVYPAFVVVRGLIMGPPGQSGAPPVLTAFTPGWAGLLGDTFFYCALITLLATALAWPAAWSLRRYNPRRLALLSVPLLLPSYLAYAGWTIIRAEGTLLGQWLARRPTSWAAPIIAREATAVLGLALWIWPLAALVMAVSLRRISSDTLDSLRMDGGPAWRRGLTVLAMSRAGVLAAAGLVMLVIIGSAVPLQVAQVDTYAIRIWLLLSTSENRASAWIASWPLLLIAVAGAWVISRRVAHRGDGSAAVVRALPRRRAITVNALSAGAWGLSVLVPVAIFIWSIHPSVDKSRLQRLVEVTAQFWRDAGTGVANSAVVGAMVGLCAAAVCAGAWAVMSLPRAERRISRGVGVWSIRLLLLGGLTPGVLVGLAILQAWDQPAWARALSPGPVIFVLAHVARFGFVGGLIGWWLARLESPDEHDLRRLDGAGTVRGWASVCLPASWPALIGAGLVSAILSFHEIEAAVFVQRPGVPFLARDLLNYLHYARDELLAVACLSLLGGGIAIAFVAALLIGRAARRGRAEASPFAASRPRDATPTRPGGY